MKKSFFLFVCLTALVAGTGHAARYGVTPMVERQIGTIGKYLPSHNEALDNALTAHNLLNKLPELQKVSETMRTLGLTTKKMQKYFDSLMKCNEQRFAGRFKNPRAMVDKVRQEYAQRVDAMPKEADSDPDSIVPLSIRQRDERSKRKAQIENEVMTDVFKNGEKYGGEIIAKSSAVAPKVMPRNSEYNVLQEMGDLETGLNNAKVGQEQLASTFKRMQDDFSRQLEKLGLSYPNLDLSKGAQVLSVRKALKEVKSRYLNEAKAYIVKLDEQDAAHPDLAKEREARSMNKEKVMARMQEQFPEAFSELQSLDYQTPQQQQQLLVTALEQDKEALVYLTATNAVEVDQRMAEGRSNRAMVQELVDKAFNLVDENMEQAFDFDFSMCQSS